MRYSMTGLAFTLFSVSFVWFSGAGHAADDPFGSEVEGELSPIADEDNPFGGHPRRRDRGRKKRNGSENSREAAVANQAVKKMTTGKRSAAELAIRAELDEVTPDVDFIETSLQDAIQLLSEFHNDMNIVLDESALDLAGVDPETPVNLTVNDVALRSVLRLMLRGLDLTYMIKDEVLLITTIEEAESMLVMEVYPVHDLLNKESFGACVDSLIGTIAGVVYPETWEEVGGTGTIYFFQGNLVVVQTTDAHERLVELLVKLREGVKIVGGPIYSEARPASGVGAFGGAGMGGFDEQGGGEMEGGFGADGGYGDGRPKESRRQPR